MAAINPTTADTLVTIKVAIDSNYRKFKVPLRELGANVLPGKLRLLLDMPPERGEVIFERYSDSAASYVVLDPNDPAVYKQLYRAAKAKLKLRLRATVVKDPMELPLADGSAGEERASRQGLSPLENIMRETPAQHDANQRHEVSSSMAPDAPPSEVPPTSSARPSPISPQELTLVRENLVRVLQHGDASAPGQLWGASYAVYCNECDAPIENEHYHCSVCAGGDFDLCCDCVNAGQLCDDEDHWLIKRFIKDGRVINSTTERLGPHSRADTGASAGAVESSRSAPAAPRASVDERSDAPEEVAARTCNSCVEVFGEMHFVECTVCEDYDLCLECLVDMKHGHNPSHAFRPATKETVLNEQAQALCVPGRNMRHYALCDGCDQTIIGVRHKCLDCPDWDYCSACISNAPYIHPGHRFIPVVEPISLRPYRGQHHYGKLCDGPLCNGKFSQSHIVGDRYKCAICHDVDFCARCEASPMNFHNRTHPLIKFRTPVRNVTVSTVYERPGGGERPVLGDIVAQPTSAVAPSHPPASSMSTTTPVHTVVEVKPSGREVTGAHRERCGKDDLANGLNALFVGDAVPDGTKLAPNHVFVQTWTIKNPGPVAWPRGCSVRFVGGDNMRNIDMAHPISVAELERSVESDVCPLALGSGGSWSFTVTLKTPNREGKCISYWRLTAPDGVKFGHKLWCDIEVTRGPCEPAPLRLPAQDPPAYDAVAPPRDHSMDKSLHTGNGVASPSTSVGLDCDAAVAAATSQPHANVPTPTGTAHGRASSAGSSSAKAVERSAQPAQGSLLDYQWQLLLLEQQNRRRLLVARASQAMEDAKTLADVDSKLKFRTPPGSSSAQASTSNGDLSELPQVEHIEDVDEERKGETSHGSQSTMIFPKLDKESAAPSEAHDEGAHEPTDSGSGVEELISEVESLSLENEDETDGSFLTDEEYDILDASDEEFLAVAQKGAQK